MSWDFIGQPGIVALLKRQLAARTPSHAYLFAGPQGIGKHTLALAFVQSLFCERPPAPGESCGTCPSCKLVVREQHPDLILLAPDSGTSLKVDAVRSLEHDLSLSPYQSSFRVGLLLDFELATISAQNALLKTLEEAPEHAILLLTAQDTQSLLPTIVSRCQVLPLRPVPAEELADVLMARTGADAASAALLAELSAGRPGYALQLAQDETLMVRRERFADTAFSLFTANRRERLAIATGLSDDRAELQEYLLQWLSLWRDVLLMGCGDDHHAVNRDWALKLKPLSQVLSRAQVMEQIGHLQVALSLLTGNVNARLLTEVLLLDWPRATLN
jgi:DNA polymerase-3 subunit delta'